MAGCLIALLLVVLVVVIYASPSVIVACGIGAAVLGVLAVVGYKRRYSPAAAEKALISRYGDHEVVRRVMAHECWIGQTEGQLMDSLGLPTSKDIKQTHDSRREEWRFRRGGLTVVLEDGLVTSYRYRE